jgi:hypothetical protein
MELENIILSEVSQDQKTKGCMFSLKQKQVMLRGCHIQEREGKRKR